MHTPLSTYLFVLLWESHHAGGVNLVVRNLAHAMQRRAAFHPLVAVDEWEAASPRVQAGEYRFRFSWATRLSPWTAVKLIVRLLPQLRALLKFLRKENVAVVNFHYFSTAALGVALLKRLGRYRGALFLSFHGTDIRPPRGAYERLAFRCILGTADALVACSHGIARRMAAEMGIAPDRIRVVYNGVDHATFHPGATAATAALAAVSRPYVVSIGSFIPRKNQAVLLRAFAQLAPQFPGLHLYMAGAEGPDLQPLRSLCDTFGLSSRVHFLLSLAPADVASLLAGASACAQPALAEGLPLAVLEAAATGVPLALSNIPGHDEVVTDATDGMLFDPQDPTSCARAIAALLSDKARAQSMAAVQRARSLTQFTWDNCLSGYLRAVQQVPS